MVTSCGWHRCTAHAEGASRVVTHSLTKDVHAEHNLHAYSKCTSRRHRKLHVYMATTEKRVVLRLGRLKRTGMHTACSAHLKCAIWEWQLLIGRAPHEGGAIARRLECCGGAHDVVPHKRGCCRQVLLHLPHLVPCKCSTSLVRACTVTIPLRAVD
jgi:hypothetical protein